MGLAIFRHSKEDVCASDGAVGAAIMVISVLAGVTTFFATGLILLALMPFMNAGANALGTNTTFSPGLAVPQKNSAYAASVVPLTGILLLFAPFFFTGLGIRRGRPWAFSLAIVLFSLVSLIGSGPAALGISVIVYCVLRKLGVIKKPNTSEPSSG